MKLKFFTISASFPAVGEEELNRFLAGHRISDIERHLVTDGSASFWAVCVTWIDGDAATPADPAKRGRIDYREVLAPDEFMLYDRLRTLRKQRAEAEGLPPFAVFTNEQLAEMVRRRVATAAELASIDGIGDARMQRYGEAFLEALRDGDIDDAPLQRAYMSLHAMTLPAESLGFRRADLCRRPPPGQDWRQ
jgi:superfamily II DNA helicase RecQ